MKFIIDEQLPPLLAQWLKARDHDAWHVADLDLLRTADLRIARVALERGAVMVTKDRDYLRWRRSLGGLQVLWLRTGDVPNRVLLIAMEQGFAEAESLLAQGETLVEVWPDGVVQSIGVAP